MNGGGFGNKPKALMCYICGREYGTASLQIHLKTCMKKWEIEESKKPKKERRPMPQPPKQLSDVLDKINGGGNVNFDDLEDYNKKANDEYNDSALINCSFCNRTFLPERLGIHNKICTAEKPFKPLPPKAERNAQAPGANTASKGLPNRGGGPSGGGYGGGQGESRPLNNKPGATKPLGGGGGNAKPSYKQEQYDEEDEEPAYKPSKPTGTKPQVSRGQPAKQSYQQPEEEDDYEQEEEVYKQAKPKPVASKPQAASRNQGYSNQIAEYDEVQLEECDICGRKFAADRLARHQKACTKVQKGEAKHAKKVAVAQKKQMETEKFIAKEAKYKKNNWRQQHEEFVNNLKYNRKVQAVEEAGGDIRSLGPAPKMTAIESNMIECPYCARKFNPQSAEKHIGICKNVINKPKAVPGKAIPSNPSGGASGYGRPSAQPSYGSSPSKNVASKVNSGLNKPMGTTAGSGFGVGGASYRGGSGYDNDGYDNSYNPGKYGGGMSQTKQGFGSNSKSSSVLNSPPGAGAGGRMKGPIPKDMLPGKYDSPGASTSYGGGFGAMKSPSGKTSSLASAGRMAMQTNYNYGSPGQSQSQSQTGLRQPLGRNTGSGYKY